MTDYKDYGINKEPIITAYDWGFAIIFGIIFLIVISLLATVG